MITADQLTLHLVGDYITQSDWMANNKTKSLFVAGLHAFVYSLGFVFLAPSLTAWLVIFVTHALIDRYRLARYVVWVKNLPRTPSWADCKNSFGYPPDRPAWMACWLMIIADNVLHIVINGVAIKYL